MTALSREKSGVTGVRYLPACLDCGVAFFFTLHSMFDRIMHLFDC